MHVSPLLAFVLAIVPSQVTAAPAPSESVAVFSQGPITDSSLTEITKREDNTVFDLVKRDYCGATNLLLTKADAASLQWDLQNNNGGGLSYLPRQSWTSWSLGSARICLYNSYLFENTHVSRWEAGWAVGYISNMCCTVANNPACEGGSCTAHGDSGLAITAVLTHTNKGC